MAEDKFYRVYSYQDELEAGKCIKFRHEISFDESKADLTELVALSRLELESRINESKSKETAIFQKLKGAISEWEVQGANKLTEIWSLVTTTPQEFKGGILWSTIVGINDALKGIAYGLLVLFFAMSIFKSATSFRDFQRPEFALRHFLRFAAAKVAVGYAMDISATRS